MKLLADYRIKELLEEYASKQTGKKKKKAESIIEAFTPLISLESKICKVYNGYADWISMSNILGDWFGSNVIELAKVANLWRNELAHEKREFEPDNRVVIAIRLTEHINYCIVLRKAGFSDDSLKRIISIILAQPNSES